MEYPNVSFDDLMSSIKGFIDMLILASGYRSSGQTAIWDADNIKKLIRHGIYFESGMLTGLLGNLTLLSYFVKKKKKEAIIVQTLGVISIYEVISQLAMAGAMPLVQFTVTSIVIALRLVLNFLNYFQWLNNDIWQFWEDFITVGGLSVLPQVMWSTFVPFIPNNILPGTLFFIAAVTAVIMARTGKLSETGVKFIRSTSGWTAMLLFMWMPIAQMERRNVRKTSLLEPMEVKVPFL